LSETLLVPPIADVWKVLRGKFDDPAYACIAALALNYHLQQHFKGAQFSHYYVHFDTLEPVTQFDERLGKHRNILGELHTVRVTTGTMIYRNRLMQERGVNAAPLERDYQHPLVLRCMNSFEVVYRKHTHRVRSFAHAFIHWVELMCVDRAIRGQSPQGGALLYPLFKLLFPERAPEIRRLEKEAHAKLERYNPIKRLIGNADLDEPASESEGDEDDDEHVRRKERVKRPKLEIYNKMTQF
jgi:hypothetical protein